MKLRFLQLEPHRQLAVAGGAALLVLLLASGVLLQLHRSQRHAQLQLILAAEQLMQVTTLAAQFAAMHASDQATSGDAVDVTAVVSRSLQAFGLQPTRMQQSMADELQLRLDAVAYSDAIAWLAMLEQGGAVVLLRATFSQGPGDTANLSVSLKKRP